MKKVMIIVAFCVVVLLGLIVTGCSQDNNQEKLIHYGKSNAQLICECALELQSLIEETADLSDPSLKLGCKIEQIDGATMRLRDQILETETTFQSEVCRKLFDEKVIDYIMIHFYNGKYCTAFSFGGSGIGSNTHYCELEYPLSGDEHDLWWYNDHVKYTQKDGGYYWEDPDGDDSIFYFPISQRLYYCEAQF